jgi:hypothetical protein
MPVGSHIAIWQQNLPPILFVGPSGVESLEAVGAARVANAPALVIAHGDRES